MFIEVVYGKMPKFNLGLTVCANHCFNGHGFSNPYAEECFFIKRYALFNEKNTPLLGFLVFHTGRYGKG